MAKIGALRERIRFTRKTKIRRADGGYDTTPTTVAEVYASVQPVRASEAEQAGRLASAVTYLISIYRRTDLTAEDNIEWVTNGNLKLNMRELRQPPGRMLMTEIVATSESTG